MTDDVLDLLAGNDEVAESYVLVRELKLYLDVGHAHFKPRLLVKIWKSNVLSPHGYHFTVSHHVHTPVQAGPYHPSRTSAETEAEAIREAINSTTSFLKAGIREGHEPEDAWLVLDHDF